GPSHSRRSIRLLQNYPNPFNPKTVIRYEMSEPRNVRLVVHDVLGRTVAVLVDERKEAGEHQVSWDAQGLPSGVYMCRLEAGLYSDTKRIMLLR
ncbi:MAG: hypothetical protein H6Q29_1182, partial [Bacteroidetes bacterium]|nr:hypothetical protein [Bacteroidota bacterium]